MRERRILIELIVREDGGFEVKATDYKLGAVRFHEDTDTALGRLLTGLRKAITTRLKDK